MNIGERIKERRKELGLNQAALAKAASISQQAISKLEVGKSVKSVELVAIARALNVTTEWLETGQEPKDRWGFLLREVEQLPVERQAELALRIHTRLAKPPE